MAAPRAWQRGSRAARSRVSGNYRHFAVLSHTWAGGKSPDDSRQRVALLLHGIIGSKANWNTPARRLFEQVGSAGWCVLQLDHRGHGRAPRGETPHTVDACAADVLETLSILGVRDDAELLLSGHSFGGKVALTVAERLLEAGRPLRTTWILDSVPGCPVEASPEQQRAEQSVTFVLSVIEAVGSATFPSRAALVEHLEQQHGLRTHLAQWVAQSSQSSGDGARLSFDSAMLRELYNSYKATDKWYLLERGDLNIRAVVAGRNRHAWGEANLRRFERCGPNVRHELLENAGHNLHVDDLAGLVELWVSSFKE